MNSYIVLVRTHLRVFSCRVQLILEIGEWGYFSMGRSVTYIPDRWRLHKSFKGKVAKKKKRFSVPSCTRRTARLVPYGSMRKRQAN